MLRSCSVLASANCAKAAGREVSGPESAGLHAEQVRSQRRVRILIFRDRGDAWQNRQMRVRRPIAVVNAQRFAISVADQRRAIHNFRRSTFRRLKVLRLGQESEPAAEGTLVVRILQAEEIRRAVGGGIRRCRGWSTDELPPPAVPESATRTATMAGVTPARICACQP